MQKREIDWEAVLHAAAALQKLVPGTVLVGGTAAAIHAGHRFSADADHVMSNLREEFDVLLDLLEGRKEWVTNRTRPPKLILGDFHGVETGLRQLIRERPLQTTVVSTRDGPVTVPTPEEMVRIKGWLIVQRNATRDYIDFAALTGTVGVVRTRAALAEFDDCYRDVYRGGKRDVSPALQLARQLADPRPKDLERTDVSSYKGVVEPWNTWDAIAKQCRNMAVLLTRVLTG